MAQQKISAGEDQELAQHHGGGLEHPVRGRYAGERRQRDRRWDLRAVQVVSPRAHDRASPCFWG